ncbi:MAG: indolepyruvate oxidoreductase subunit beta family protein [Parazoarcus communis]
MTAVPAFASVPAFDSLHAAADPQAGTRPLTILIAALGGEGGGVLAEWLVELATRCGYVAQSTSIPGVAQRTGATTYYVEIHPQPISELAGRRPVLGLAAVPGAVDVFIASELLEAARHAGNGMLDPARTLVIASTSRSLTTAERMQMGDGRSDGEHLLRTVREHSLACAAFDIAGTARACATVPSAVMFGALAASGRLPFPREAWEAVIRASGRGVEASLRGFDRAWQNVGGAFAPAAGFVQPPQSLPANAAAGFPAEVADIVNLGLARVRDYQDAAYGERYLARVRAVLACERRLDPEVAQGYALTRETARFLALWMAFDDIVRVARLKCSATRFARVRREAGAGDDDLLRIVDHFKPGVPELAGLLPARLEAPLLRWAARRRANGKAPLELALHLDVTRIRGFLALRLVGGLRWLRPHGMRFAREQAMIEQWLACIVDTGDWGLAHELALCGRLIKGYGATNDRGRDNLAHILTHLAVGAQPAAIRAEAVRRAREAALADEAGTTFDQVLREHGAPSRPVKAQPINFVPRRVQGSR